MEVTGIEITDTKKNNQNIMKCLRKMESTWWSQMERLPSEPFKKNNINGAIG